MRGAREQPHMPQLSLDQPAAAVDTGAAVQPDPGSAPQIVLQGTRAPDESARHAGRSHRGLEHRPL